MSDRRVTVKPSHYSVDAEERARRQAAIDFARSSVRLEGFQLSEAAEALFTQYINGDISRPQLNAAVRDIARVANAPAN